MILYDPCSIPLFGRSTLNILVRNGILAYHGLSSAPPPLPPPLPPHDRHACLPDLAATGSQVLLLLHAQAIGSTRSSSRSSASNTMDSSRRSAMAAPTAALHREA